MPSCFSEREIYQLKDFPGSPLESHPRASSAKGHKPSSGRRIKSVILLRAGTFFLPEKRWYRERTPFVLLLDEWSFLFLKLFFKHVIDDDAVD
ncbi:hypothetical protein D1B31_10665 [Neobacillus notoginsengisoli]|uniref:Uncharacterized protein n=1 Tax=Neobacillus notoginsengisoli TaxID=1578198 RepID=A0A417YTZ6_9BACI|nr:hypothetical protein D1B31_10665 [Neobacillus notoginsengisoli]